MVITQYKCFVSVLFVLKDCLIKIKLIFPNISHVIRKFIGKLTFHDD